VAELIERKARFRRLERLAKSEQIAESKRELLKQDSKAGSRSREKA